MPPSPSLAPGNDHRSTAVLWCNLGSPDAPTASAVRSYLADFLGDPRVVEIPRLLWLPILHGIILRVRPAKSAAKYASIWLPEGSPLKVWSERQARRLGDTLGRRGHRPISSRHQFSRRRNGHSAPLHHARPCFSHPTAATLSPCLQPPPL